MKFAISALLAFAVGLPLGGCTGIVIAAVVGGGALTVYVVTLLSMFVGYQIFKSQWDEAETKAIREHMEMELLAAQWEELRTRKI
jgi:uncharacterized membrane protein YedE/YeeE